MDATFGALRDALAAEDDRWSAARERAGAAAPPAEVGAFLGWLATTVGARSVVEIGSGCGLTGLWLLRALGARGMLTTVEHDPDRHTLATQAFQDAGAAERVRAILGDVDTVLGRLSDGAYDLCVVQERVDAIDHALRLLRPGGVLVVHGIADDGAAGLVAALEEAGATVSVLPFDDPVVVATPPADGTSRDN